MSAQDEIKSLRAEAELYKNLLAQEQKDNEALRERLNKLALDWQVKEAELEKVKAERDEAYNNGYAAAVAFIANSYQTLGDLNTAAEVRSMHTPETSILCQEREKLVAWADTAVLRAEQAEKERDALIKGAESTLTFYAKQGRVVVAVDGNAVQRMGASAEIAISHATCNERQRCAEIARTMYSEEYKDAGEGIAAAIMEGPK